MTEQQLTQPVLEVLEILNAHRPVQEPESPYEWRCVCGDDPGLIHVAKDVVAALQLKEEPAPSMPHWTRYVTPYVQRRVGVLGEEPQPGLQFDPYEAHMRGNAEFDREEQR